MTCRLHHARGFTLMEIVLAIALTSVVMYLLTTAIELYMIRVDSSRTRVESAQLARTILDQMAADLTATRLYAPAAAPAGGQGGSNTGGGAGANNGNQSASGDGGAAVGGNGGAGSYGGGNSGGGAAGSGGSGAAAPPTSMQGLYGDVEQIRIDRGATPNWQRAARDVAPDEPTASADLPRSVRYYFVDGDRLTPQQLAQQGISDEQEQAASVTGLYRETMVTASLEDDADPLTSPTRREGATVELLAPEVVKMEIAYFDGKQLVDQWDSLEDAALPAGVEIRLTLYEPVFNQSSETPATATSTGMSYRESELVEYRRFVRLPTVSPPQQAVALLPQAGGNNGGGQAGGGQPGQGGQNGGNGGNGGGPDGQQGGGNGNQ